MREFKVTGIRKNLNSLEGITHLECKCIKSASSQPENQLLSRKEVISSIEAGESCFYIEQTDQRQILAVAKGHNDKYLFTSRCEDKNEKDRCEKNDCLLQLPEV